VDVPDLMIEEWKYLQKAKLERGDSPDRFEDSDWDLELGGAGLGKVPSEREHGHDMEQPTKRQKFIRCK
jgi:hypothetical protein